MALRLARVPSRIILLSALAGLVCGCAGTASASPSPATSPIPLTEPAAKEALLARFGLLVYCDPDFYPVARADESSAASEHLAAMRADTVVWAAIADRQGFDPSAVLSSDELLAAYRDWKMLGALALTASDHGWTFDASFGGTGADATTSPDISHVVGTIRTDRSVHIDRQEPGGSPPCPICLALGTKIATPAGEVAVEALRVGDPVWTLDRSGRRIPAVIAQVGSTAVPPRHEVVRLVLADGRSVLASPGHPLPDGRPVADLRTGDTYGGSSVTSVERFPYDGGRTFDLLPSGGTGVYWANGIELGSTLVP